MGKKSHSCVPLGLTYSTTAPDKLWVGLGLGQAEHPLPWCGLFSSIVWQGQEPPSHVLGEFCSIAAATHVCVSTRKAAPMGWMLRG